MCVPYLFTGAGSQEDRKPDIQAAMVWGCCWIDWLTHQDILDGFRLDSHWLNDRIEATDQFLKQCDIRWQLMDYIQKKREAD